MENKMTKRETEEYIPFAEINLLIDNLHKIQQDHIKLLNEKNFVDLYELAKRSQEEKMAHEKLEQLLAKLWATVENLRTKVGQEKEENKIFEASVENLEKFLREIL
jgi:hypothetical protein